MSFLEQKMNDKPSGSEKYANNDNNDSLEYFKQFLKDRGLGGYLKCQVLQGVTVRLFGVWASQELFGTYILTPLIDELSAKNESMLPPIRIKFRNAYEDAYKLTHSPCGT